MTVAKRVARAVLPRPVRNWLRSPSRSAHWLWCELRHALGAEEVVEMRPGWSVRCRPGADAFSYHAQRDDPEHVAELDQFIAHCRPGMTLFDAGAHFGLFSLAALHYGGPEALAVAIDPSPLAVRVMRSQARLNGVANRWRIVPGCLGDREGAQPLVSAGVLCSGYYVPPGPDHPASETKTVPAFTLDGLTAAFGLRPTHIKIDVEGFEGPVLDGDRATLSGPEAPLVFLELHCELIAGRGGVPGAVLDRLLGWGYRFRDAAGATAERDDLLRRPLVRLLAAR
jgi:FkbM family methyltransferase